MTFFAEKIVSGLIQKAQADISILEAELDLLDHKPVFIGEHTNLEIEVISRIDKIAMLNERIKYLTILRDNKPLANPE